MEQIFFLILLAVVGLLRWISQMAEEKRNREAEKRGAATPAPNAPVQRAPARDRGGAHPPFHGSARRADRERADSKSSSRSASEPKPAAAPKRKVAPIDPFPRGGFPLPPVTSAPPAAPPPLPQQPPLVPPSPRVPAAPSPVAVAPPLPTRETTVFAPTIICGVRGARRRGNDRRATVTASRQSRCSKTGRDS